MKKIQKSVVKNKQKYNNNIKKHYDITTKNRKFKLNDLVFMRYKRSHKLQSPYKGPYTIKKILSKKLLYFK